MDNFDLKKYLAEGRLLKEDTSKPKGIILAGGAGSGKSYYSEEILGNLNKERTIWSPKGSDLQFTYINPDVYVERDGLSLGAAMGKLKPAFQGAQDKKENILWDTTAASVKNTLSQMSDYDKFMIMIYTHPIISILKNVERERTLPLEAVIKTWDSVYGNIGEYKSKFGDNFVLVKNIQPGYEKEIKAFDQAVAGGKDKLKQYLSDLVSQDKDKFKSSFSKEFKFSKPEIEDSFEAALPQTSYNEKEDIGILKGVKKEFEKEYLKKNEDPGKDRLEKKLQSARKTKERNEKNYNESLEGVVNKLTSSEFKEITEPISDEEIKSRFNNFLK